MQGGWGAEHKARHKCQLRAVEAARANSGQERDARECSGRRNKSKQQQHDGGLNPTLPTAQGRVSDRIKLKMDTQPCTIYEKCASLG